MTEAKMIGPEERFQDFLKSFRMRTGEYKYRQRIAQMAVIGTKSLIIDFDDLMISDSSLAMDLIKNPDEYLAYANRAAWAQLKIEDPEYAEKVKSVNVRFRRLPETTPLRYISSGSIGKLVMVDGILVRATTVKPLLLKAAFKCRKCGEITYVEQSGIFLKKPLVCANPDCARAGSFDLVEDESVFINFQEIRIQEKPEDLPPGQLPRSLGANLIEDLVDVARPGDRVTITGIVRTIQEFMRGRGKLRTFDLFLDVNNIDVVGKESEIIQISPAEEKQILELARDPRGVHRKIIRSIAPSIYGYDDIKEAIMYLLFGGVPLHLPDGVVVRGDVNVLLIGDPGTAKSQLLQYVSRIAPRGLYTSGRGSTAAGLTAAVMKDKAGGMSLEAGALVLADKGVCCIDEIDKMKPDDRVAIHEAMEQQTVSVAKGGIVATLNARASILAAANPALGRYDSYRTVVDNINLPVTILSRFDLIFVIRDEPLLEVDTKMAEHILSLHKTGITPVEPPIPLQLLRKYISYARQVKPTLTDEAMKRLRQFYLQMRTRESSDTPVAITPRQLESLVRLAEARARAALRDKVAIDDAEAAIRIMKKSLEQVGIDVTSGKYDIDIIMTGKPKSIRDKLQTILSLIVNMEKETGIVNIEDLYNRLEMDYEINRIEASRLIDKLTKDGTVYVPKPGYLKKT